MGNVAATLSLNVPAITAVCKGPRGSTILRGSNPPTISIGLSGDYYIDILSAKLYGPKEVTWPDSTLTLSYPSSAFPYSIVGSNTAVIVPIYGNNTIKSTSINSAILGGANNSLTGNNSFIIGSNITAAITGFTLLNNLSSTGTIYASSGNSNQWNTTYQTVYDNKDTWNLITPVNTTLGTQSANNISVYSSVNTTSGNWNSVYTGYKNASGTYVTYIDGITSFAYTRNATLSSIQPVLGGNTSSGKGSVIGGGKSNTVSGNCSNIGGGVCNSLSGSLGVIGGGYCNTASGDYSTIIGGYSGAAIGKYSVVGGGATNTASGYGSFVSGICNIAAGDGKINTIIGGCQHNIIGVQESLSNAIIGGTFHTISGAPATTSKFHSIIGGCCNCITASCMASIIGGTYNTVCGTDAAVIGGRYNSSNGTDSVIIGGCRNTTGANNCVFILGQGLSATQANYTYVNNLSSQGSVAARGGDSSLWNSNYTNSSTNSASWTSVYSYVNTATANTLYINNLSASGRSDVSSVSETKAMLEIKINDLTLDLSTASLFYVNLNKDIITFNFINPPPSPRVCSFTIQFVSDGTAHNIAWPASVSWPGGVPPVLTTTVYRIDTLTFFTHDGGTKYFGFVSGQNFA